MNTGPDHSQPPPIAGDEISGGVFDAVLAGYDAVYAALPRSDTFNRLWRSNAYREEFPAELPTSGS